MRFMVCHVWIRCDIRREMGLRVEGGVFVDCVSADDLLECLVVYTYLDVSRVVVPVGVN